ncbi:MAG: hypothetical protein AB7V39_14035 [Nitrospiraceae bacterium]
MSQKRKRYANDPDYAESIKESVRRQRQKRTPSDNKRSFNRDKVIVVDGVTVSLVSSGKAARLIGISPKTLSHWEKKNFVPLNHTKDRLGRRWYPLSYVMFLANLASDRPSDRLDEWSIRVKEAWMKLQLSDRRIPVVSYYLEDHDG